MAFCSEHTSAMAVQTKLANTTAILSLYLRHLSHRAEATMEEVQLVSSLLSLAVKEQAIAAGNAIASLWVARRHLWLAQSRFQPADHTSFTGLPIEPTAMFGSGALTMLQQAQEARRYASELSGPLAYPQRSRRPQAPSHQAVPSQPSWGPGDLRQQLGHRREQTAQRHSRGRGTGRRQSRRPPPRS